MAHLRQQYAEVRLPLLAATALDDPWRRPVRAMRLPAATATLRWLCAISPRYPAVRRLATWAISAQRHKPLWDEMFDWFQASGHRSGAG